MKTRRSSLLLALILLTTLASTSQAQAAYKLTRGQETFAYKLSALTQLNINVVRAWCFAEDNGSDAARHDRQGKHNWLNVAYFDSRPGEVTRSRIWRNPNSAAVATAAFLQGRFLGPSPAIRRIVRTVGRSPGAQINATWRSGWATSTYGRGSWISGAYKGLHHKKQPRCQYVRNWLNPHNKKRYTVGNAFC